MTSSEPTQKRDISRRRYLSLPEPIYERLRDYRFTYRYRTETDACKALIMIGLKVLGQPVPHNQASTQK